MATDIIARAMAKKAMDKKSYNYYDTKAAFPTLGQEGQLYFDKDTTILYYWDTETFSYQILVSGEGSGDIVEQEKVEQAVEDYLTGGNIIFSGGSSDS